MIYAKLVKREKSIIGLVCIEQVTLSAQRFALICFSWTVTRQLVTGA